MPQIESVFEVSIEEAGDYIFSPVGIVILFRNKQFTVYSESARHNFIRRVVSRYPWPELLKTVTHQDANMRLRELTAELQQKTGLDELSTEAVLQTCYDMNPRQLFFLRRYLSSSPSQTNMPPS